MRRRTPQEKKALSLLRDRRNAYGESPHGARKAIPLRKKLRNRANRRQQDSQLPSAPIQLEQHQAEEIDASIRHKAPKSWNKVPDAPLANVLAENHLRRVNSHGRKTKSKALQAFKGGQFSGECPACGRNVYILVGHHAGERYGAFCAVGQGLPDPTFFKVNIRPCEPSELPELPRKLYSLCVESQDPTLGDWVCRLFGRATCPQCRKPFDVAAVVAASDVIRRIYSASRLLTTPPGWLWRLSNWLYVQP